MQRRTPNKWTKICENSRTGNYWKMFTLAKSDNLNAQENIFLTNAWTHENLKLTKSERCSILRIFTRQYVLG